MQTNDATHGVTYPTISELAKSLGVSHDDVTVLVNQLGDIDGSKVFGPDRNVGLRTHWTLTPEAVATITRQIKGDTLAAAAAELEALNDASEALIKTLDAVIAGIDRLKDRVRS